jgi:hypothetical protein
MRFAGGSLVVEDLLAVVADVSAILTDQSCWKRCCGGAATVLIVDSEEVVDERVFRGGGAL